MFALFREKALHSPLSRTAIGFPVNVVIHLWYSVSVKCQTNTIVFERTGGMTKHYSGLEGSHTLFLKMIESRVLKERTPSTGSDKILPSFDVKLVKTTFPHATR